MLFEFLETLDIIEYNVKRECAQNNICDRCKYTNCSCYELPHLFNEIRKIAEIALNE